MGQQTVTIIGCGDIGQRLARYLPAEQYRLVAVRRRAMCTAGTIEYRRGDFSDRASLEAALSGHSDVVVLTLTPSSYSDDGYQRAYVQGTANLLAALQQQPRAPRLLLFVSSTSVYGQNGGQWVDENSPTIPSSFSGKRLLQAEQLLLDAPCQAVVVRCSGIYGPGRNRLLQRVSAAPPDDSRDDSYSNRIHVEDCAAVIAHLITRQDRGLPMLPLYLASDCLPAPGSDVRAWLRQQLAEHQPNGNGSSVYHPADQYPGNCNAHRRSGSSIAGKRCRNQRLLDSGYRFQYPDFRAGYPPLVKAFLQQSGAPHA